MEPKPKQSGLPSSLLAGVVVLTILAVFAYLIVRTLLFFSAPYPWHEKIVAFMLLMAECFILTHGFGYFLNLLHIIRHPRESGTGRWEISKLTSYPPVAIIVSSYREPIDVVEDTLTCFYNLTYSNKHLYFLDDTRYDLPGQNEEQMQAYRKAVEDMCRRIGVNLFRRKWHGAKAGMINDFLNFLEGRHREGFTLYPFADRASKGKEKYIIVFDADMNPFPDFVEQLVAIMETNPELAFVQTPQYYSNFEQNRVARAAGLQQAVFYEYICEGKSLQDAMFCCGTNVIFRRQALVDVGGFDESSVTEDFATSLKFHGKGWGSAYLNRVCAFGMGPEDLGGYFKQQFRWALGTVGLFRTILHGFIRNPRQLTPARWWEYFLSGTHYFIGWAFFTLVLCPILYLFFNVPAFFAKPDVYFLFFTPYLVLSLAVFLGTLHQRGYGFGDLFQGIVLNAITFPVFMKASLLAMIGVRGTFGITPKGRSLSLPMTGLLPQIIAAAACLAAVVWGIHRLYYERDPVSAIIVNCIWCLYHFTILAAVFYFNHPEED